MSLKGRDLDQIRRKYGQIWKDIKIRHPGIPGTIKFSVQGKFVGVGASLIEILRTNPDVFLDSPERANAIQLIQNDKRVTEDDITFLMEDAPLNPDCQVEIVWGENQSARLDSLRFDPAVVRPSTSPSGQSPYGLVLGKMGLS